MLSRKSNILYDVDVLGKFHSCGQNIKPTIKIQKQQLMDMFCLYTHSLDIHLEMSKKIIIFVNADLLKHVKDLMNDKGQWSSSLFLFNQVLVQR